MNRRGISLIVLVITIIIIVILAGAVIINLENNGPVVQASQATFKANLAGYNNELSLYISNQYLLNDGKFNSDSLNALTPAEVKDIIKGITDEDAQKIKVIDGKLSYIGVDQNEIIWAEQMDVSLDVPYVKNGLVLWYDGIYNGGFGVHNDNLSVDKGVWKDLSGNGNDGSLQSFDYNTSNGWINNGLKFNGRPNLVNFNLNIPNKHTIEFIVMPRKVAYNGVFSVASNLERTYSCGVHSSNFLFYNTSLSRRK